MTLDASPAGRVGLPVDARGELPDAAALADRLRAAIDRAVSAGLDVELHVDPGTDALPAPLAEVVTRAREDGARRGVDVRVVS
ncbi:hypothetical protein [Actinomycetospora sp.]|jgi:DNA repair photolyase|uniref:hypothetical protein n=1 Tax=Actinomycetospora sp. TaxID=1872135 RepID=UPI002F3FA1F9